MPAYRFYKVDEKGHIQGPATNLEFDDDATALKHAKQLVDGHDVEVWQSQRPVGKIPKPQ